MKRIIVFLAVSLVILSLLPAAESAAEWKEKMQRNIVVQGNYGTQVKVKFDRIATQSSSFSVGMPFDIEGRLVQYNATEKGREIAYWSVAANTKFTLKIKATKLVSEGTYRDSSSSEQTTYSLDYYMTFTYDLGYTSGGTQTSKSGEFKINTESETEFLGYVNEHNVQTTKAYDANGVEFNIVPDDADTGSVIGSVNGSVYFMFTDKATGYIKNGFDNGSAGIQEVPSGNYYATITLDITAVQ